ncbi:glycosyltransferase [bacterium]|nr:glycosyltransferase [bacterium]
MSPQKGPDIAIKAVKSIGAKLILAGKISGCDNEYLRKKVFPYIDGKNIKYVGEVGFNKKINLIKNARALLHPHKYFEAFGISLIESQACGTPVITFLNGASSEVVSHNKTGYVVKNLTGIKSALNKIDKINRIDCRNFVKENFSFENMTIKYENIYKKLIKEKKNE